MPTFTTNNPPVGNDPTPRVNISVTDTLPVGDPSNFQTNASKPGVFTDYVIQNRYFRDAHTYMMGVSSPAGFQGKSAAFCQLAGHTLLWVTDWTASKWATKPNIPDPAPTNAEWILMDVQLEPYMVAVNTTSTVPLYRISGVYVYGMTAVKSQIYRDINFPRPPWLNSVFTRTISPEDFEQGLSDLGDETVLVSKPLGGLGVAKP